MAKAKRQIDTVVLIPVGPNVSRDFLVDNLESLRAYMAGTYFVILLDDSGKNSAAGIVSLNEGTVIDTHGPNGVLGGGFASCKVLGVKYAVEHFTFRAILLLDTDALIIGYSPDLDAIRYFESHPTAGILGAYKHGGTSGWSRHFSEEAKILSGELVYDLRFLIREVGRTVSSKRSLISLVGHLVRSMIANLRKYRMSRCLRKPYRRAVESGYSAGEHCLGGTMFLSPALAKRLYGAGYLSLNALKWSVLADDFIFGLLTFAVGMKLHDFNRPSGPLCLQWKGLPDKPDKLLDLGVKIVHSTRSFEELVEADIRKIFQTARTNFLAKSHTNSLARFG